jgi:N-acetylmuramoyl-L-alanine amidase
MKKITTVATSLLLSLAIASEASAYTVKSGDTMNKIAQESHMSLQDLIAKNPQVKNPNLIYVGDNINTTAQGATNNNITATNVTKPQVQNTVATSNSEEDLLARLVRAEAESEPYAGKVAVARVVLNRVAHPDFPNTISGVIYESGQFSPVSNGTINRPADAESIRAVKEAISIGGDRNGALFFYNPKTASNNWNGTRQAVATIGNHVFSK